MEGKTERVSNSHIHIPWRSTASIGGIRCGTSAPKWPTEAFPPLIPSSPPQTWHDNCCFAFSLPIKKNPRDIGADVSHVTGWYTGGIAFSMTAVKRAACWHSKPHRKDGYKLVPGPPSLPSPAKMPYLAIALASHHTPYESKTLERERERQGLTSTWHCLPIFSSLSVHFSLFLPCFLPAWMINPCAIFKAPLEQKVPRLHSVHRG